MKRRFIVLAIALMSWASTACAQSLWDELLSVTEQHIKTAGPDSDTAQFISLAGGYAWDKRDDLFALTRSHLDDSSPHAVSGAIETLYRLRGYQPMEWIGGPSFAEVNAGFFAGMDKVVLDHFPYFKSLNDDEVFRALSLYLGVIPSPEADRQLREVAGIAKNNEQTLIAIAWHRDRADMDFLMPYMLADTAASNALPYQFRASYGHAAIPYLRRAASEAKSKFTRQRAAEELGNFGH